MSGDAGTPYVPPEVWEWKEGSENPSLGGNRPTAGARVERTLPLGKHPIQLYSLATPNGQKVTIFLEELLAAGVTEAEYDAWPINIMTGDQFGSDFVAINPNSKIPAMRIYQGEPSETNKDFLNLFESGSILLHLAEKFQKFIPTDVAGRAACLNWLFWSIGSAPFVGGGFGHFYQFAPDKQKYPIDRFTMETKRQLDVLNQHLAKNTYMVGDEYTIADIVIWPWHGGLVLGNSYKNAHIFLNVQEYPHVIRWAREIASRPAVKRGKMVNKLMGATDKDKMPERHSADDFLAVSWDN